MVMDKLQFQAFLNRLPDDLTIFPVKAIKVSDNEGFTDTVLTVRIHLSVDATEMQIVDEVIKIENDPGASA